MISFGLDWFVELVAVLGVVAIVFVQASGLVDAPIHSDGFSYYVYLPAWFLYGDPTLDAVARDCCGGAFPEFTAIVRWPTTGAWVDAHPIGVALMQAPAFAVAHLLTRWSNLPPDGFSLYYQQAAALSGLAYMLAGLAVLRAVLRRLFTPAVTLSTLAAITFGTNLFHYGVFDATFSHAYSFFLVAALLFVTERWWAAPRVRTSVLLGIVSGLLVLVRHPNVVFLAFVPAYGVTSVEALRRRASDLWRRRGAAAIVSAVALVLLVPQVWIYRRATGRWLVSSYGSLGFTWSAPHLYGVLFSVQKGLFFWSPVLLLAVAGLLVARGKAARLTLGALAVLILDTYIIASWWDWQFGASFGHRGFTDALPVFAVFLASFYAWAASRRRIAIAAACATAGAIVLSTAQMLQYWLGILPVANTTWPQYRVLFLRFW